MKKSFALGGGYTLKLKFTDDDGPIAIEGTLLGPKREGAGEFHGELLLWGDFDHYTNSSDSENAYSFFNYTWKKPSKLKEMGLSSPFTCNSLLHLKMVKVERDHRGKTLGVRMIRKVIEFCADAYMIDAAFGLAAPQCREEVDNSDDFLPTEETLKAQQDDLRSLTGHYTQHLGPKIAWAGNYMILPVAEATIPASMREWTPARKPGSAVTPKLRPFLKGETWAVTKNHSVVEVTRDPSGYIGDERFKLLRYTDGVPDGDFGLQMPDGISLLVEPSDLLDQPNGAPIMRWTSPDGLTVVEAVLTHAWRAQGHQRSPFASTMSIETRFGQHKRDSHDSAPTLRGALICMCYALTELEEKMRYASDVYERRGIIPVLPTPEQSRQYASIATQYEPPAWKRKMADLYAA